MAFWSVDLNLRNQQFDARLSGCTANTIILSQWVLTCCNVGDSRCILGTMDIKGHNLWKEWANNGVHSFSEKERKEHWRCISLSKDHKPTVETEKHWIQQSGGRVIAVTDPSTGQQIGPHWVWLKDIDIPGLAMTWSFGDEIVRQIGVICDPEIREIELEE